jgi:hypothetical protein
VSMSSKSGTENTRIEASLLETSSLIS